MACKSNKTIGNFFEKSAFHMADITAKQPTFRRALAMGRIEAGSHAFTHIKDGTLPKGDVLKLAEIAGVQGAKNTWQQIPLCHPLMLDHVAVHLELEPKTSCVAVYCIVATTAKTGVEMEALAGVQAALLTLYDLTKPVEPALTISDTRLLLKEGGKKGLWIHPDGLPDAFKGLIEEESMLPLEGIPAAVITLSDRASRGEYEDKSGPLLQQMLEKLGCKRIDYSVLPDEASQLQEKIGELSGKVGLIITTGGTGVAPRDGTPEALRAMANVEIPGIGELLRSTGAKHLSQSWLSRSTAVIIDDMLVIALPGSPSAVTEGMEALRAILPHAIELISGNNAHHHSCKTKEHAA